MNDVPSRSGQWLSPTLITLILANLVPLYGVLALGWEVYAVVLLFWLENLIIGGVNALRMLCCQPQERGLWLVKMFLVPFFCFHYGIFTLVHGAFIIGLFGGAFRQGASAAQWSDVIRTIGQLHLGYAAAALLASHGFAFVYNFLWRGEFRTASLTNAMQSPYGRVVVLHIAILGGAFLILQLHAPQGALALLVLLKIILDVRAHNRESKGKPAPPFARRFSAPAATSTAP
ncbi:MAG TPA: DUF6498-containing protein [Verrucomicrobiota bacterium]|nr:DUF6498-containing protein [Verrucomicrobiota bacterium]HNT13967.1 DUF6498-containing protein [Verrucomicrobiota bacterium]